MITSIKITSFILQSLIIINYDNAGPNDVTGGEEMNEQIITTMLPLTQEMTSPITINEQHTRTNGAEDDLGKKRKEKGNKGKKLEIRKKIEKKMFTTARG